MLPLLVVKWRQFGEETKDQAHCCSKLSKRERASNNTMLTYYNTRVSSSKLKCNSNLDVNFEIGFGPM